MRTVVVTSDNENDAYVATLLLFISVEAMAEHNIGGWELVSSFADHDGRELGIKYSNGDVFIKVHSSNGVNKYSFGKECEGDDEQ